MAETKQEVTKSESRTSKGVGAQEHLEVLFLDEGPTDIQKRDSSGARQKLELSVSGSSYGQSGTSVKMQIIGGEEVMAPPFSIDEWALAPEISTRLNACIFIRSRNTAGLGYELVPKDKYMRHIESPRKEMDEDKKKEVDELLKIIDREKEVVEDFLDNPHPTKSFSKIFNTVIADEEAVGNGYMEVRREILPQKPKRPFDAPTDESKEDEVRQPKALDRIVGHRVRIKKGKKGYIKYNDDGTVRHFKTFGDTRVINAKTGKIHSPKDGLLPPTDHATELIHFKLESFRDTPYGMPRYLSAGPAIAGNRFAAERNARFFENDATPRMAIIVHGPYRLSKQSQDDIKDFLSRKGSGPDNQGRVMVIQAGTKEGSLTEKEDVKIQFEKLTLGLTEDAGFLRYQDRGDREIAEAFNLHPVFFEKDASRASANVGRSITLDQVFEPDIVDNEYILNNTIIKAFGVTHIRLKLKRPKIVDEESRATILQRLVRSGGVTPNDIREFLRKPRFIEPWADFPLAMALQQLKVPESRAEGSPLIPQLLSKAGEAETQFDLITSLLHLDKLIQAAISEKEDDESNPG